VAWIPPVSQETFERMELAKNRRAKEREKENLATAAGI